MPRLATTVFATTTLVGAALLSACDQSHSVHAAAPQGTVAALRQPMPDKPLFNAPIVKAHDVLPQPKADSHDPLPPGVPLASAQAASTSSAGSSAEGGGVNPAAGMAAAVTDSKGTQHDGDGK